MASTTWCKIERVTTPAHLKSSTIFESASYWGTQFTVHGDLGSCHVEVFIPDYMMSDNEKIVLVDAVELLNDSVKFKAFIQRLSLVDYDPFEEFVCFNIDGIEFDDVTDIQREVLNSKEVEHILYCIDLSRTTS